MNSDQPHLFELPEIQQTSMPHTLRITLAADLPGPGYDHLAVELINDTLARLCHETGLFANRLELNINLDYIDESWFITDTSTIASDTINTDPDSAYTHHPRIE